MVVSDFGICTAPGGLQAAWETIFQHLATWKTIFYNSIPFEDKFFPYKKNSCPGKSAISAFLGGVNDPDYLTSLFAYRRGKIHPPKDVRNGVIEYGFPGRQMLEYGFPGGLKAAWGSTNPKITNDHFFPLRYMLFTHYVAAYVGNGLWRQRTDLLLLIIYSLLTHY